MTRREIAAPGESPFVAERWAYDGVGHVIRHESRSAADRSFLRSTWSYDEDGRLEHRAHFRPDEEDPYSLNTYEYDAAGHLTRDSLWYDGEPLSSQIMQYDADDRLTRAERWRDGQLSATYVLEYDEAGQLARRTLVGAWEATYVYAEDGALLERNTDRDDDGDPESTKYFVLRVHVRRGRSAGELDAVLVVRLPADHPLHVRRLGRVCALPDLAPLE